jgi:Uma2 family endonuclease
MATQTQTAGTGLIPYRITVRQFEKMIKAGVFPEGVHVELLGGILVEMTRHRPHDFVVGQLGDLFRALPLAGWFFEEEKSSIFGRYWRPEADFAVVRGQRGDFRKRSPRARDISLLVEVADSSYPKDVGIKLRRYAGTRVPVYWVVNVGKRQIDVYSDPKGRGASARYQATLICREGEQVPVVIDGQERGSLAVADLLP